MSTVAMSGDDTVIINNHVFKDFADGNVAELTYPNKIANAKTGKNGNTIYSFNATGKICGFKLRIVRGSEDDKFLNGLLANQQANFAGFPLMAGTFVKKLGDGLGNITSDTYVMSGGVFEEPVSGKSNVEGDTEQSVAMYSFVFSNSQRAIT